MHTFPLLRDRSFWLPTAMVIAFLIFVIVALQVGESKYTSVSRALTQWDGQHYLSIARDGYEKYQCPWDQTLLCGNIGWFPFYPLVGRLFSIAGIGVNWSMIIVSWLSLWAALLLLFRMVESCFSPTAAVLASVALLVFPTSFYYATVFPYSLNLLLAVLVIWLLWKHHYTWLFVLTGFLTVTYPSGGLIGLPVAYHLIGYWRTLTVGDRLKLVAALVSMGVAMFLYFAHYYLKFDDFLLYLTYQHQSFYAHKVTFPLITLYKALTMLPFGHPEFVTTVVVIAAVGLAYSRKVGVGWQLYMLGILLFTPTFGTTQCYYRHIIVAFPLFVMIGMINGSRWRKYLFGVYVVASLVLMFWLFLPTYKMGNLM